MRRMLLLKVAGTHLRHIYLFLNAWPLGSNALNRCSLPFSLPPPPAAPNASIFNALTPYSLPVSYVMPFSFSLILYRILFRILSPSWTFAFHVCIVCYLPRMFWVFFSLYLFFQSFYIHFSYLFYCFICICSPFYPSITFPTADKINVPSFPSFPCLHAAIHWFTIALLFIMRFGPKEMCPPLRWYQVYLSYWRSFCPVLLPLPTKPLRIGLLIISSEAKPWSIILPVWFLVLLTRFYFSLNCSILFSSIMFSPGFVYFLVMCFYSRSFFRRFANTHDFEVFFSSPLQMFVLTICRIYI